MAISPAAAAAKTGANLPDLPEEVLITILSLLPPADAAAACCSCRRLAAAFSSPSLPVALSLRFRLPLPLLPPAPAASRRHFRSLHRLHRLAGLWRHLSSAAACSLAAFEWGPRATLAASLLTPSGGFAVARTPLLRMSITGAGDTVGTLGEVPVCVNFVGSNHVVVEAAGDEGDGSSSEEEAVRIERSSPPGSEVSEIYRHFANRTNPMGRRRVRRQERGRRRRGGGCETQHFVRIAACEPTKARPLQGLWKGICENRNLEFYVVSYDDIGGITCRRISDGGGQFSGYSPVFWTTNATFLEPPFSEEELDLYSSRKHIHCASANQDGIPTREVSRILCINSSYDLVIPDLSNSLDDLRNVVGRVWQYEDGTFGFGFLGNNSIVDLRHVTSDGCILDAVQ